MNKRTLELTLRLESWDDFDDARVVLEKLLKVFFPGADYDIRDGQTG